MRKTRWFPADVKPKRKGWYESRYQINGKYKEPFMVHWDGKTWSFVLANGKRFPSWELRPDLKDQWRGLTKRSKK